MTMKTLFITLVLLVSTIASAKTATDSNATTLFSKKSWELSMVGSFTSESVDNGYPNDDKTVLSIAISPAYYIYDGLSLEPEFTTLITISDGTGLEADYQLLLNIGYTFRTAKSYYPYIKAGYGIGNIITEHYSGTQATVSGAEDVGEFVQCINSGVGMKWVIGSNAAIKMELNYRRQHYSYIPYDSDSGLFGGESDNRVGVTTHRYGVLLGMSIFL